MTPTETATLLRQFNEWRRGDEDIPQFDQCQIGEVIDAAVEMIDRLEAAESDALEQACLNGMGSEREVALMAKLEAAEKERDALRSKIEAMEQQEPIGEMLEVSPHNYELRWYRPVPFGAKLYALPGAQPQLNEIRTALQRALELGARETWTGARKHRSWEDQREEQQCWNKVWSLLGTQGEEK